MRRVLVRNSLEALRGFAATRGLDLASMGAAECVDVVSDWYLSERADDIATDGDVDMLLFQWGTYDWGGGASFEYDVTRQLMAGDTDDDDAAIWQLSCTLHYPPSGETEALGRGDRWCASPYALDEFRLMIEAEPATAFARSRKPARIEVSLEQAGELRTAKRRRVAEAADGRPNNSDR
jgi:hypothetical protein